MYPQLVLAQLTGTKTIPGDYATISAAVTDLNTQGVGAGGVTFNVTAGYTESIAAPITITATGTAGNAIVFQKNGAGANPLITRTDAGTKSTSTLGGDGDAVIQLNGTDYITFNGIDVTASDQGIEYGYYTFKPSGTDGCQFVTIKNCVVTLTKGTSAYVAGIYIGNGSTSTSSAVGVTVTAASGMNSNVTITGNIVQNVFAGILVRGSTAYYDSAITIGQSGAGNMIQNFGASSAATTYGVYFIYVESPSVAYNTIDNEAGGGTPHNSTFYCIFYSIVSGDVVGSNNTMKIANSGASSSNYYLYNGNTCSSENYNNNTFAQGSVAFGTGTTYFIYSSNATPDKTISGNSTVGTITKGGGGTYCYYNLGSPSSGTETITNNNISNLVISSGSSTFYGYYSNTASGQAKVMSNNTFSNISSSSTGSFYCFYSLASIPNQVNGNTAFNINHGAGSFYGVYVSGTATVYNNQIHDITGGASLYGMYISGGIVDAYKNSIYGLSTTTTTTSFIDGIYTSSPTTANIYNNFVSDLNAPASTSTTAGAIGIYLSGGTTVNLSYNTVFLKYTSTVATNQSAALYVGSTTPTTVNMYNNIFVNNVDVTVGTRAMAFRKGGTSYTNLVGVDNNLYYAGTPSATNVIFYDGTNTDQTLSAYKSRVSPKDALAVTENPPFVNSTVIPYNLHMNTTIPTQTESGGTPVATVTTDYDGDTRNATHPDIGADEFGGQILDLNPPVIVYTPLLNTTSTSARTLTASVSDAGSGVPTAGLGLPRLYWKKNFNGAWTGVTSTYLSGSNYQFSFGGGVTGGDTVYYYVVAQDGATTPNVIANPSTGAGGYTANPPAASVPPTSPYWYFIVAQAPLAGNYTVGLTEFNQVTGKNIYFEKVVTKVMEEIEVPVPVQSNQFEKGKEQLFNDTRTPFKPNTIKQLMQVEKISWIPMENGKPFEGDLYVKKAYNPEYNYPAGTDGIYSTITAAVADLNLRGVSAAVNFLLNDVSYTTGETYPIVVNINNVSLPTATNKVTIKPNTGVTSLIQGTSASGDLLKILTSYVNIDGSNSGGTDRSLTIENNGTTTPRVVVFGSTGTNPITGCSLKNTIVINGATTSSAIVISDGATPGNAGYFTNISIQNNSIQKAYIGAYCNAVLTPGNGNGLLLNQNDLNTSGTNSISLIGLYVQGADGATVSNNNIGNFTTAYTSNVTGIWFATGTINSTISNNTIGPINITTAAPRGIVVSSGLTNSNVTVSGNTVSEMKTSYGSAPYGIYVFSTTTGVTVEKNKVSSIWNTSASGYGARGIHIYTAVASSNVTVRNNFVWDVEATSDVSSTYWGIGIGIEGTTSGVNVYFNNVNLYGSLTGYTSGTISAAFAVITSTAAALDVRDNIFVNTFDNTNSTTDKAYSINSQAPNTSYTAINYNDYYVSGTPGILGYLGADQTTLAAWQTATGQDANSINDDPHYVSDTDLHINTAYNTVSNNGQYLASVTTDIDGNTRSVTTPDIGADEYTYVPPAVIDPTGVTATPISGTQIDVAFTPNGNNNNVVIVFNLDGNFTTPSGAPPAIGQPFAGGTLISNGLTSPLNHTGLTPITTYYYMLFSYNGSLYSPGVSTNATTPCGAITSFPWTEGFESVTIPALPDCWYKQNGDWVTTNNSNSTYDADAHTGTQFLRESYNATNEYVWSPGFDLTGGSSYDFSFWWAGDNYSGWTGDVFVNTDQDSTGASQLGISFVTSGVTTTKVYQLATYTFVPSISGTYYFAIRVNCPSSTPWYLSFDDFRFEPTPACPMPTGLTVTGITNISANIGWSDAATVDIDYGTPGHPAGSGTVVSNITTNPYTLGGLSAYTTYDVYVRQNCGSGSYSTWAGPLNFTTQANPATVPYTQTFDGTTFPPNWFQSSTNWSVSTTSNAGGSPNEMKASWFSFVGTTRLILGPINTTGMTSLKLAFKHFFDDYGPGITVRIQSSTDASTWTDEAYSFVSGGGNIGPETVNTTIGSNVGTTTYIAWTLDGDHYQYDYWYVDDVVVSEPLPNDVGTFSIDVDANIVPGSIAPQATVKNFGLNTNSFNVQMNITGGYTSTKTVTNLAPGATQQVTFDNWNPSLGQYAAKVFTQLGTDGDHTNDTLYKNIGVYPGLYTSGSVYPTTTYLGSGVAVNGYLYSIGGNTTSGLGTECYKYNVATDTWTPIASLPSGLRVLATAAVGNYVYAIGGSNMSSVYQTSVYKYDIVGDAWTTVASLPMTIGWGKAVGYNNNYIYLAGGYDGVSTVLSSVYVYDITANTWTSATSMPGPKFGGAFSVTGNTLVYAAGADDIDISSSVYVGTIDAVNPLLITWTTMAKQYPGISKQLYSEYHGRITELLKPKQIESEKIHLSPDATSYPPGAMYRFDGAPWGADGIIVAAGSPTADWVPADPSPTYVYKPATDTWTQQADVPEPVLGASMGTVNTGNIWKLVVASGLGSDLTDATQIYTADLGGTTTFQLSVDVSNGWNMVSVPGTNTNGMGINNWWINHTGNVYKFVPGSGYNSITTTAPGEGYWMKNTITQTYNTGDEWPSGGIQIVAHNPINVAAKWNMMGGYEDIVDATALTTTPSGQIVYPLYKFVPGSGYQTAAQIVPGFAYWVKVSTACVINVPDVLARGNQKIANLFNDDWGKITITDAAGSSYTLYAVKGQVDLDQYELPPLPPEGLFDVRFSSGRIAEDIITANQTMEMRGITYPVKVKAENVDIRLMDETGKLINMNVKSGEEVTISNSLLSKLVVSGHLIPDKYSLEQNYPNPFNPNTTIEFSLPENVKSVRLSIYNVLGEKVSELVNGELLAGRYQYQWNAKNVASGMYIYELRTEKFNSIKKMLLLK